MKKTNKMKLENLELKSFVTTEAQKTLQGGVSLFCGGTWDLNCSNFNCTGAFCASWDCSFPECTGPLCGVTLVYCPV